MSTFVLAKGFTKPIENVAEHGIFGYALKLRLIYEQKKTVLFSKSTLTEEINVVAADMIEIFTKHSSDRSGMWSVPETVLSVKSEGRTVIVPARGGKSAVAKFEDIKIPFQMNRL